MFEVKYRGCDDVTKGNKSKLLHYLLLCSFKL